MNTKRLICKNVLSSIDKEEDARRAGSFATWQTILPDNPFVKNTVRSNPHLNALQGASCLPVRGSSPHRQVTQGPHAVLRPIAPAGEYHEAAANGMLSTLLIFNENSRPSVLPGRASHRGNVTSASPGRVAGPAACTARRGPDGVRGGSWIFAKNHDIPGLPTGGIPSRWQRMDRERCRNIAKSALLGVSLHTRRADYQIS